MLRQNAIGLLFSGSEPPEEDWQELHEQRVFDAVRESLPRIPVPMLLRSAIQRNEPLIQAERVLALGGAFSPPEISLNPDPRDPTQFFKEYEHQLAPLKLQLTRTTSFAELNAVLSGIQLVQEWYEEHLLDLFSDLPLEPGSPVKGRDQQDTGQIIVGLRTGDPAAQVLIHREVNRVRGLRH